MRPNQLEKMSSPSSKRKSFLDALPAILIGAHGGVLLLWKHGLNPTNEARAKLIPCRVTGGRNDTLIEILIGKPNAAVSGQIGPAALSARIRGRAM